MLSNRHCCQDGASQYAAFYDFITYLIHNIFSPFTRTTLLGIRLSSLCCVVMPGLSKEFDVMNGHTLLSLANHQSRHQARSNYKMSCQPVAWVPVCIAPLWGTLCWKTF